MVHDRHVVMGVLFAAASLYFTLPLAADSLAICRQGRRPPWPRSGTERLWRWPTARSCGSSMPRRRSRPLPRAATVPAFVAEAKQALTELASGAEIELRYGGAKADRHGRALAQVYVVKAASACGCKASSCRKGLARVYSFPDNHACVDDLLAREAEARAKGAGLWGTWAYRVLDAGNVERLGAADPQLPARRGRGGAGRRIRWTASISTSTRIGARISPSSWRARMARPSRRRASIPSACRKEAPGAGLGRVA